MNIFAFDCICQLSSVQTPHHSRTVGNKILAPYQGNGHRQTRTQIRTKFGDLNFECNLNTIARIFQVVRSFRSVVVITFA